MKANRRSLIAALCSVFIVSIWAVRVLETTPTKAVTRSVSQVPAPEDVLGFRPGDDRKLASWKGVVEYFQKLAAARPSRKLVAAA